MYRSILNIFVSATIHLTKPKTRSIMAGRSESHSGKNEEPYGEEKGDSSSMKNLRARMLLGKALTIVKGASKSKKKFKKIMREAEKFHSFDGLQADDDATDSNKVSSLLPILLYKKSVQTGCKFVSLLQDFK